MTTSLAAFASILHIYIFFMESIWWGSPRANRAFAVSPTNAEIMRPFAFNQGFYNLFLALAILAGLVMVYGLNKSSGVLLVDYAMMSIFGAGVVLLASNPHLWIPALAQAGPPLLYGIFRFIDFQRGVA